MKTLAGFEMPWHHAAITTFRQIHQRPPMRRYPLSVASEWH